jgi:PAS domain S-box-containing protein
MQKLNYAWKSLIAASRGFFEIPFLLEDEARRRKRFEILLGMMLGYLLLLLGLVVFVAITDVVNQEVLATGWAGIIILVCIFILRRVNHSKYSPLARFFFVAVLFVGFIFEDPSQTAAGRSLLYFSIPILAAGILLRPWAGFVAAGLSALLVGYLSLSLPNTNSVMAMLTFFLLALMTWLATDSLEKHIHRLAETNSQLEASEAHYRTLLEISPTPVALLCPDGQVNYLNQAGLNALGLNNLSEALGRALEEWLVPTDRMPFRAQLSQLLATGQHQGGEYRLLDSHGQVTEMEYALARVPSASGQPQTVMLTSTDITLRKQTENSLRTDLSTQNLVLRQTNERLEESEAAYQILVENSVQGMVLLQNGRVRLANQAFAGLVGLTRAEIYALPSGGIYDSLHPEDRETVLSNLRARLEGKPAPELYEIRLVSQNGTVSWIELMPSLVTLEGSQAVQVTLNNITARKQAEQAAEQANAHRAAILNAFPDLMFELDSQRRILDYHTLEAEQLYLSPETFLGKNMTELLPKEAEEIISAALDGALESGSHHGAIYALEMPDGLHWYELSTSILGEMNGPDGRYILLVREITRRKRTEIALRESQERYRSLAETAEDLIFIVDRQGRIEYLNQYTAELLGKHPEELLGQPGWNHFRLLGTARSQRELLKGFRQGLPVYADTQVQIGEHEFWLSTRLVPIKDSTGQTKSILGVSRDISERKALELAEQDLKKQLEQRVAERTAELDASREQLRQLARQVVSAQEAERRRLARELHDEAGQVLIGLKYTLDELLAEIPPDLEPVREKFRQLLGKIDALNQQLRALAYGLRPPMLDVAGLNLALNSLCRETNGKNHLRISYSGVELPNLSDEIGITLYRCVQEGLTNILKHARASEVLVRLERLRPGEIRLSLWDNGSGFEPETAPKGLGLNGMEERFKLLGGQLKISSTLGHGTQLEAWLPFTEAESPPSV